MALFFKLFFYTMHAPHWHPSKVKKTGELWHGEAWRCWLWAARPAHMNLSVQTFQRHGYEQTICCGCVVIANTLQLWPWNQDLVQLPTQKQSFNAQIFDQIPEDQLLLDGNLMCKTVLYFSPQYFWMEAIFHVDLLFVNRREKLLRWNSLHSCLVSFVCTLSVSSSFQLLKKT